MWGGGRPISEGLGSFGWGLAGAFSLFSPFSVAFGVDLSPPFKGGLRFESFLKDLIDDSSFGSAYSVCLIWWGLKYGFLRVFTHGS